MAEKVRYFELRDDKSSKFWEMSWSGGKSFTVRYGKIGTDGRTSTKSFPSADEAKAAANKLMVAKHAKGYVYMPREESVAAAAAHWFERYRELHRDWWRGLDEDEREDFAEFELPDKLRPVSDEELQRLDAMFPELPEPLRVFLTRFGIGEFHFDQAVYYVFPPDEIEERLESIAAHAGSELEALDDEYWHCNTHGGDVDKCRALLTEVRDHPNRFYPLFGPDDVYNFVYVVVQGSPRAGSVGRWYHDYPVCELLDGSGITKSLDAYGEKLLRMARKGDASPV